jgi:prophage regulatory protein
MKAKVVPNNPASVPVIPDQGFVRVHQLIGCRRRGLVPILPISRSGMYAAIREGRIPPPTKLGPKVIAWPAEQIKAMLEEMKPEGERGLR